MYKDQLLINDLPEEKTHPLYIRVVFLIMALFILFIPLWKIDPFAFNTNEIYMYNFSCTSFDGLYYLLISCQ